MSGQQSSLWGPVTSVPVRQIPKPPKARQQYSWHPLAVETALRLERTGAGFAIRIPVTGGAAQARSAATCIRQHVSQQYGPRAVKIRLRVENNQPVLYVSRGDNYRDGRGPEFSGRRKRKKPEHADLGQPEA